MANTNKDIDKILQDIKMKKSAQSLNASGDTLVASKKQAIPTSKAQASGQHDLDMLISKLREEKKQATATINKEYMPKLTLEDTSTKKEDTLIPTPSHEDKAADNLPSTTTIADTSKDISNKSHIIDEQFVDFFTQSISVSRIQEESDIKPKKRGFVKKKYITDSLSLSINDDQVKRVEEKQVRKKRGFFDGYDDDITTPTSAPTSAPAPAVKPSNLIDKASIAQNQPLKSINTSTLNKTGISAEELASSILAKKKSTLDVFTNTNSTAPYTVKENNLADDYSKSKDTFTADTKKSVPVSDTSAARDIQYTSFINPVNEDDNIKKAPLHSDDTVSRRLVNDITAMFTPAEEDMPSAPTKAERVNFSNITTKNQDDDGEVFETLTLKGEFTSRHDVDEDCDDIINELNSFKTTLRFRVMLGILTSIVLIYLSFSATFSLPIMDFMAPNIQPLVYYIVSLVFYGITLLGFFPTICNGFRGLFFTPTSDSFLFLPSILCLVQLLVAISSADKLAPSTDTIFAGFIAAAMAFNALGKLVCANTITRNLSLADIPSGINAGYLIKNPETVKRLARTLEEKAPQVLVSRKAGSITNFISGGFSVHSSEIHAKKISIFSCVVTLICFIMTFVLTKNLTTSIFAAVGSSVLMVPLSHTLISSIPSSLLQKALNQVGALVNGWYGIDQISKTTHVSFDARHLFPRGTVVLHGIKTFEQERLDHAILYAASIIIEHCEILRPIFMNVIENKTDILYPIESCEYKAGQGYVAWIEHNRVILGNRSIMSQFDIELPPISLETKFTSEGKKPIYLSVNGKLFGMFVVSYHQDSAVKENLDRLIKSGVNIILKSNDFSLDSQLLELIYKIPLDTVQVLNQNETALLQEYTQYIEKTESSMAHLDSLHSLVAGFCGADSARSAAGTCNLIQLIGVIIGGILSLTFAYSQTLSTVPLTSVFLLSFGWLGLSLMRAFAKKYY